MSLEAGCSQEIKDLIQRVLKDITMRQMNLSLNKGIFEGKQKECKLIIKQIFENLSTWASRTEAQILKQVDDVAERRRQEMEEMSCSLICLPAQLAHQLDDVNKAIDCLPKLNQIQSNTREIHKEAERIYPNGSSDALVSVEFHLSSLAQSLFLDGNTDELFRINTCLKPEELFIVSACHVSESQIRIEVGSSSSPIHSFILSEMSLCILSAEQRLLTNISLKTLYVQKHLVFSEDNKSMCISLSGQNLNRGSFINITLISYSIKNSPAVLKNSAWNNIGDLNNNCTRTGKPIDDLDESDLVSMGYKHSDKSIFRDKADLLKNEACRSLLENGITPKISLLPSEKSLIRLNPTPNVTPTIEGIAEIRNRRHILDENDETIDPSSETLIDKGGQHPLSSTIRCSQSPIGKNGGGISSPFTDRNAINLPLDQPSPLNIHSGKQKQQDDGNGSTGSNDATPCTSTQNNLSERLRSISFPKLDDEDEDEDKEYSETRKKGLENLAKVQKLLTGELNLGGHASEESKFDKSVTFHPNTTIMEPAPNRPRRVSITSNVNVMDLLPEDKETNTLGDESTIFLDVTDRSSGEELWQIRTGMTKTTDGELTLCKTIMQSQNLSSSSIGRSMSESTAWAYDRTLGSYTKSLKDSNRYTKPGQMSFNESLWENSMNASDLVQSKKPKLNLGASQYELVFVKKYTLNSRPQTITIDDLGYKYISHPEENKISMLRGKDKIDIFKHDMNLKKPGYILALPNDRILILDSKGFHMFTTDGTPVKSFLTEVAKDCRGLAYDHKYCHVLTAQKGEAGTTLLIIDAEINYIIVKKILIQNSADTPSNKEKTKCVFLTYCNNQVFISDFGLGLVYVVYLNNDGNKVFCRVPMPRGLRADPHHNLLLTSIEPGLVYVFSPSGEKIRSLNIPQVKNAIDLYVDHQKGNLYVIDNYDFGIAQYHIRSTTENVLTYSVDT